MTFDPISYVYIPTAQRSKSTKSGHSTTKNGGTASKKSQHIQPVATALVMLDSLRPSVVEAAERNGDESRVQETATPNSAKRDDDFPSVEEVLYTALQERGLGLVGEHGSAVNTGRGEREEAPIQGNNDIYNNTSGGGENLGNTQDDPIILGEDESSASEADFDFGIDCAVGSELDAGLFSPVTSPESRGSTSAPSPKGPCYNVESHDSIETTESLGLAEEQEALAVDSTCPSSQSSRPSSEPLPNLVSARDAAMSPIARARIHTPSLLHTGQRRLDEHELVRPLLTNICTFKGEIQQQWGEREGGDKADGINMQQEPNDVAAVQRAESMGVTLAATEDESPGPDSGDSSRKSSLGDFSPQRDVCSDDGLDNSTMIDGNNEGPRTTKRKRQPSPVNVPTRKKHKGQPRRSPRRSKAQSKLGRRSPISYSRHHDTSASTEPNIKGQLPSPLPSIPRAIDTEMGSSSSDPGGPSRISLPILTEITFRPQSPRSCSFTAVVRDGRDGRGVSFSQLGQLIEGIGYIGKLGDVTIKPLQNESFLLTGVGHYTSSRVSPSERKTLPPHTKLHTLDNDEAQTRLRHGRAGREDTSGESSGAISDDERLSDNDPDPSGGDDGCCSEDEQHRLSTRRNIPWDEIEEQRLRVYREEGKPWKWIFKKFPGRTEPAIRMRWTIIQQRAE